MVNFCQKGLFFPAMTNTSVFCRHALKPSVANEVEVEGRERSECFTLIFTKSKLVIFLLRCTAREDRASLCT